jgi:hypothetical protein
MVASSHILGVGLWSAAGIQQWPTLLPNLRTYVRQSTAELVGGRTKPAYVHSPLLRPFFQLHGFI